MCSKQKVQKCILLPYVSWSSDMIDSKISSFLNSNIQKAFTWWIPVDFSKIFHSVILLNHFDTQYKRENITIYRKIFILHVIWKQNVSLLFQSRNSYVKYVTSVIVWKIFPLVHKFIRDHQQLKKNHTRGTYQRDHVSNHTIILVQLLTPSGCFATFALRWNR